MAVLNQDIPKLNPDSPITKLFKQLYDGMVEANKAEMPSTDEFVGADGAVDEDGINNTVAEYSDILMQNSAYNIAKSIIDAMNSGTEGSAIVFPYIRTSSGISDDAAIENALNGISPSNGNMVIIIDTNNDGDIEYGRTGFVYNDGLWKAFSGRVDAKNIIVRGNMTLAGNYTSVGNINKGSTSAITTLDTDGLSVMDVLNKIFSQIVEPTVVQPSISSFVIKANSNSGPSSVEIGTNVIPYWKAVFNAGSYSYNNTEVSITSCVVSNSDGEIFGNISEGTYETQVQITEDVYNISIKISYSDGAVPLTNMKAPSTQVQGIKAGTLTNIGTLASYRKIFYGYSSGTDINNSIIRSLTGKANAAMSLDFDENTAATQIIIAAPSGTRRISKVIMPSSSNADVTAEFVKQATVVKVAGANNFNPIDYDVWIYKPAKMAGTYTITIA